MHSSHPKCSKLKMASLDQQTFAAVFAAVVEPVVAAVLEPLFTAYRLPPRALDLMKDIVFKFGCWDAELGYRARREEFLSSWQDLLDFIQGNFNLSKLSLTIYSTVENASSGRGYSPQPKEDEGKVFYRDILGPVRSLKGLKAYFVYLEDDRVRHMEEESEKDVMGENYDSARFGKIATEDRQGRYI
ncbi:hypothetical protein MMC10_002745 [Thelotrema lepadinum]|nr:hypothetical protein [Thelotrema lepadinum]